MVFICLQAVRYTLSGGLEPQRPSRELCIPSPTMSRLMDPDVLPPGNPFISNPQ